MRGPVIQRSGNPQSPARKKSIIATLQQADTSMVCPGKVRNLNLNWELNPLPLKLRMAFCPLLLILVINLMYLHQNVKAEESVAWLLNN